MLNRRVDKTFVSEIYNEVSVLHDVLSDLVFQHRSQTGAGAGVGRWDRSRGASGGHDRQHMGIQRFGCRESSSNKILATVWFRQHDDVFSWLNFGQDELLSKGLGQIGGT